MSKRIFNFSAGPAVLPEPVLKKAQEAIWDASGSGIGIMEHSHRGKVFDKIRDEAEQACRDLAGIPDNYRVLFLQGGASLQFSMVPMNLLPADRTADYLLTGVWAQKAVKEAKILGAKVHIAATGEATNFDRIPKANEIKYSERPAYVHLTTNIKQVHRAGDPRVLFPGYVFGRGYWELQRHAYAFCAPTEVGGTHPVILEALAAGNCVIVNDHAPNVETVGDAGLTFSGVEGVSSLASQLERILAEPSLVDTYRARARERARRYDWDAVTDEYESLLRKVCELRGPGSLPAELIDVAA